jgi:predicted Mrr-cat superfamily restriction endonuclease
LAAHPDETKIGAGLACGALWTIAKGIGKGEIVLCPDGAGAYRVGEVIGGYQYAPGQVLPHRRPVQWMSESIDRAAMTDALRNYPTDTGPIGVLAIRKDRKELLVLELKKGRASDAVVGQVLRYMGYALQELAGDDQTVRGVIIALEDDQRLRRALAATSNLTFYRYQVNFKLLKA